MASQTFYLGTSETVAEMDSKLSFYLDILRKERATNDGADNSRHFKSNDEAIYAHLLPNIQNLIVAAQRIEAEILGFNQGLRELRSAKEIQEAVERGNQDHADLQFRIEHGLQES